MTRSKKIKKIKKRPRVRAADLRTTPDGVRRTWTAMYDAACPNCPHPIVKGVSVITRAGPDEYVHIECT